MDMSMKDSVNNLFQQRFQGHEALVDPGVWQGIQQQLATAPATDGVTDLFKDRFQGHELPVDPAVWNSISSQLGHTAVTGTATGSVWGWAAAGIAAVAITAGVFLGGRGSTGAEPNNTVATATDVRSATPVVTTEETTPQQPMATLGAPSVQPTRMEAKPEPSTTKKSKAPRQQTSTVAPGLADLPNEPVAASTINVVPDPTGLANGEVVVSDIILGLTEKVIQEPVTAQPEPGLASKDPEHVRTPSTGGGDQLGSVSEVAVPENLAPLPKLFMPNTFTPNGDLVNDTYTVGAEGFQNVMIRVYSLKSNALVFSTNNGEAWSGATCEDGMYMVAAEALSNDGRTVSEGKVVWLNRNPVN